MAFFKYFYCGSVAEWLEQSTVNPSMRVHAPLGADFSAHCEIKRSLNHFVLLASHWNLKKGNK